MLISGMDRLIKKANDRQKENFKELEQIIRIVPMCCIDIIHGYCYENQLNVVDWSTKFKIP